MISLAGSNSAKSDALQGNTERCSLFNYHSGFQGTFGAGCTRKPSQSDCEPLGIQLHPTSCRNSTCSCIQCKSPLVSTALADTERLWCVKPLHLSVVLGFNKKVSHVIGQIGESSCLSNISCHHFRILFQFMILEVIKIYLIYLSFNPFLSLFLSFPLSLPLPHFPLLLLFCFLW